MISDISKIEQDNNVTEKDSQNALRNMELPGFLPFDEKSNSNSMDEDLEKWAIAPRIPAGFSCKCLLCFP